MGKKLTLEIVKERLSITNNKVFVLRIAYECGVLKVFCSCPFCGYKWKARYSKLYYTKTGCPKCARKLKLTTCEAFNRIKIIHPEIEILSSVYTNAMGLLRVSCTRCKNIWEASYNSLVNTQSGCPNCANLTKQLTTCEAFNRIKTIHPKIEILTATYNGCLAPLNVRCKKCRNEWQSSYDRLYLKKQGCRFCANSNRRLNETDALGLFKAIHPELEVLNFEYQGIRTFLNIKCKICKHSYQVTYTNAIHQRTRCPRCARKQTKGEKQVQELLESLGIEFIMNDRKTLPSGKELDFYIPNLKIAIEINGEFWHSSAQERIYKNYHLDKTRECEALGIHLFQFWHLNDLVKKTAIVESMIRNALKLPQTTRIFARKCEVRKIDSKEGRKFCEQNHIQGGGVASVYFGLFYKGKLVSVMSFGKSRFNKKVEWELIRFCSLLNHSVVGAGSRLLKHFELECKPKSLISYANRRWASANSNLYQTLGFTFLREAEPNYTYYKEREYDGRMFNRITFQRHKIEKWFGKKFDKKMTETQILLSEGFVQIYDCGNLVYLKEYDWR